MWNLHLFIYFCFSHFDFKILSFKCIFLSVYSDGLLTAVKSKDVQKLAKKAAETVVLVIDEEGIEGLISELLKGVGDNQVC